MEIVSQIDAFGVDVLDIINHYVENTGYTFIEYPIPYRLYQPLIATLGQVLTLVAVESGKAIGIIMFKSYSPVSYFNKVAEMGIYIHKDYVHKGIGTALLKESIPLLKLKGKSCICSTVSSINQGSIAFHELMGFSNQGKYKNIGKYNDKPFSVIHFQKDI